jgi:four helix bundle protein
MPYRPYTQLDVWNKAMSLAVAVYGETARYPASERFSLVDQARRAAVSIAANIAEGHGRTGAKEYGHFVSVAYGSLNELETLLHLAERIGYSTPDRLQSIRDLCRDVGQMLVRLRVALRRRLSP